MKQRFCLSVAELALDVVESHGFDRDEVSALQPLQFISRNKDSGSELRGRIQV